MENNISRLTAKQARAIVKEKTDLYHQECEKKAIKLIDVILSEIEKTANNKLGYLCYIETMESSTAAFICDMLRELGYVAGHCAANSVGLRQTINITW